MNEKLEEAFKTVDLTYGYLADSAQQITKELTNTLDSIVAELSKGINLYSNAELWDFQVRLSIEAYTLGNLKEQASLKDACAEALYKEGVARAFVDSQEKTQEAKKQQAIVDSLDKQTVSLLHSAVAGILKTKCDEAHRLVNVLQGIQISRAAEAKQQISPRSESDKQVSVMGMNPYAPVYE